jgi:GH35 family endo-1,4-beta-xylanase
MKTEHTDSRDGDGTDDGDRSDPDGEATPNDVAEPSGPDGTTDLLPVSRRTWLKSGAAAVAAGLFGAAGTGTAAAAGWEADADARIQANRVGTLDVTIEDASGNPIPDAEVKLIQVDNDFSFGTALDARNWSDVYDDPDDPYLTWARDLFDAFQLKNYHKWRFWEDLDQQAMGLNTTEWAFAQGLTIMGHVGIWQIGGGTAMPDDVEDAIDADDAGFLDPRSDRRIKEYMDYWGDDPNVESLQIVNEQPRWNALTDVLDPNQSAVQADVLLDWHNTARNRDGDGVLYTNSYNFRLARNRDYGQYETLVDHLLDAALDGVGFQGHHVGSDSIASTDMISILDSFAALGALEFAVTEFDYQNEDFTAQERADYFYRYLKTFYSHPNAKEFHVWGFSDETAGRTAALFDASYAPKLDFFEYVDLVFNQWYTSDDLSTDSNGTLSKDVHRGEYFIEAADGSAGGTATVTVPDTGTTSVTVTLDGGAYDWDATSYIHVEEYDAASGIREFGNTIGYFDGGDYIRFDDVDFGDGVDYVQLFVGTDNPGEDIEVRIDGTSGTKLATLTVTDTGGYNTFCPQSAAVTTEVTGTHDLYLVGSGGSGIANVDYVTFDDTPSRRYVHLRDRFERYQHVLGDKWVVDGSATVSASTDTAKQGSRSCRIDGPNAGGIRSAAIDTSAFAEFTVEYWASAGSSESSPEAGEELYLEVKESNGSWREIDRISNFSRGETFDRSITITDGDVMWSSMKLRWLRTSSSGQDAWYVDDVTVSSPL